MIVQPFHIRVAAEEPEQFVEDGLGVELLRGQQREAIAERKTCLCAEDRVSARPGAVGLELALLQDEPEQLVILINRESPTM